MNMKKILGIFAFALFAISFANTANAQGYYPGAGGVYINNASSYNPYGGYNYGYGSGLGGYMAGVPMYGYNYNSLLGNGMYNPYMFNTYTPYTSMYNPYMYGGNNWGYGNGYFGFGLGAGFIW